MTDHQLPRGADLGPTSQAGFAAFQQGVDPAPEQIDAQTYCFNTPAFEGGIVTSTFCYVLAGENGAAHLIDPGMNSDRGWQRLRDALELWGFTSVASVVVTHMHLDHVGMAERVRQEWGAPLIAGSTEWQTYLDTPTQAERNDRYDQWGVPAHRRPVMPPALAAGYTADNMPLQHPENPPDCLVDDGAVLDLGRPVTVMLTPGHTDGGLTLRDDAHRLIIVGDEVLPNMHTGLGLDYDPLGDPVGDYLDGAQRLADYDGYEVGPGHGFRFTQLGLRLRQTSTRHLHRSRELADALAKHPDDSVWQLAQRLSWGHGFDNLEGYFLNSALQQTAMHLTFIRSSRAQRWLGTT